MLKQNPVRLRSWRKQNPAIIVLFLIYLCPMNFSLTLKPRLNGFSRAGAGLPDGTVRTKNLGPKMPARTERSHCLRLCFVIVTFGRASTRLPSRHPAFGPGQRSPFYCKNL